MAKEKKTVKELTPEEKLVRALVPVGEQPYGVPENWCWVRLASLIDLYNGDRGKNYPTHKDYQNSGIPFISASALKDGLLNEHEFKYITEQKYNELSSGKIMQNDILYCLRGSLGKTAIVDICNKGAISSSLCILRAKYGIFNKYLFYLLNSDVVKRQQDSVENGSAQPNLSAANVIQYMIPLPPLAEQQRIVGRIESLFAKLDEAKGKAQAVVDGFELRRSAILHKAFTGELTEKWRLVHGIGLETWERTEIASISDVKGGKRVPKGMSLTSENTGHPYIKAGNLKQGTVLDDEIMYVPNDVLQYIKNYTVHAGDVYITNVGACIGDCGIIPEKYDGANLTENAVKITNLKCDSHFLAWYLSSGDVQQKIKTLIASATLGKLSITNIKTIPVLLPTKEEQTEIIKIIGKLLAKEQQAKEAAETVLAQIDTMKKAILARAFRGELGTNDPEEESAEVLLRQIL